MSRSSRYLQRGVSSGKEDVHQAIRHLDKGLFPGAFCKVIPDMLTGDPDHCLVMHADGAGTKSSLAYIYWKETGDISETEMYRTFNMGIGLILIVSPKEADDVLIRLKGLKENAFIIGHIEQRKSGQPSVIFK